MHTLHLLRHAKSDRDEGVDDRERRLARRGRDEARRVGKSLVAAIGPLDLVLCSPSVRTRDTAALVLAGFAPPPPIRYDDELYLARSAMLLRVLRRLDEAVAAVLLIGHNPGLHELATALAAPDSPRYAALAGGKFPTLARASLTIAGSWDSLDRTRHPLADYVTPKSLR